MTFKKMSELDEIKGLLKKGEEEKAFELIKDKDKNSVAKGLIKSGENEEYDLAIIYFTFSEKIATDSDIKKDAYFKRGNAYDDKNEFDSAIKDFNEVIRLYPDTFEAYYNRGNAYRKKGEFDRAIKDYNKAIDLKPEKPEDVYDVYINCGFAYALKEEFDRAIDDYYNKAIDLNSDFAPAYFNRGAAYHGKGDFDKAIENYNKAIERNPKLSMTYNNRGAAYHGKGDFDKAIENYNKAIKRDPNFAMAYNNRGYAYYKLKRYLSAKRDYNTAIELKPDLDIAHANLGNSLFRTEDYDNAEKEYRAAIRINNNNDYAHKGLGLVLSKRKAYKEAIEEFKKVSKRDKDADFYNNLGCAYVEYGKGSAMALFKFLKGRKNLRKATQEGNTFVKAHKNLTSVGGLLNSELKIALVCILIIPFVFVLSINLLESSKANYWLKITLILTGVVTLGIVLLITDVKKIKIKSLGIPGVLDVKFDYEEPKAGEIAMEYSVPEAEGDKKLRSAE